MRTKVLTSVAAGLLALAGAVLLWPGDAVSSEDDYNQIVEQFFAMVEKGEYGPAIDFIYADNPWMSVKSDDVINLRNQFVGLGALVGPYIDRELMHQEVVGDRYVHQWYFVATERQPLVFMFQFYKPAEKFLLFSFAYDGEMFGNWVAERGRVQFVTKE